MTHDNKPSSAKVEREVEARRADLHDTLSELTDRMSPGQLLDETWKFARRSGGGSYVRNLGSSVRDNPLPVALIGAGIAWLMSGRGGGLPDLSRKNEKAYGRDAFNSDARRNYARSVGDDDWRDGDLPFSFESRGYTDGETSEGFASGLLDTARSTADSVRDAASSAGESLSETAGRATDRMGDSLGRARDYASESASALSRDVSQRGRRLGRRAWETGRNAQQRAVGLAEEQPITLALAGIALGALIGAALKSTAAESRLMGEASDRVKDQARGLAEKGVDEAANVAENTYEAVKDEAREQGFTTADASDLVGTMAERLKKVADRGTTRFREEIDAATGTASGTSESGRSL